MIIQVSTARTVPTKRSAAFIFPKDPPKCSDCGWHKTWVPCEDSFRCMRQECFKGGSNLSYTKSPAWAVHFDDPTGVGLFLATPPDEFKREVKWPTADARRALRRLHVIFAVLVVFSFAFGFLFALLLG